MSQIFTDISDLKKYINVSFNLDIRLLAPYEQEAVRHVGQFIPVGLFPDIENEHADAYDLLKRAIANYTLPFAAPFLKVHMSNTGANHFRDDKMQKSSWWDVRDYCLSALSIADNALSDTIEALQDTSLSSELTLFDVDSLVADLFPNPKAFERFFNIGNSWEVLKRLEPIIVSVFKTQVLLKLDSLTVQDVLDNEGTADLLRKVIANYALLESLETSILTAVDKGFILQWEHLPWKKSSLLSDKQVERLTEKLEQKTDQLFVLLLNTIKSNPNLFPYYQGANNSGAPKITKLKSGLSL